MKKILLLLTALVMLISGCAANPTDEAMRDMTTQELIEDMGLGINLGNNIFGVAVCI